MKLFLYSGCQKFFGRGGLKCPMFFLMSHLCFVCCLELLQNLLVDSPCTFGSAADFGFSELCQHLDLQGLCRKQRLCLITALPEVYTGFSGALFLFFHPFKTPGTHSCLSLWKTLRSSVAEGVSPSCAYLFREIKV